MFSSILCAARWEGWDEEVTAWAIVLGDQPHLSRATLATLLAFQQRHPQAICQPAYGGHGRHPVILPRGVFAKLKQSRAATLKGFLRRIPGPRAQCPIEDPNLALDLDWPKDYQRLLAHAKKR